MPEGWGHFRAISLLLFILKICFLGNPTARNILGKGFFKFFLGIKSPQIEKRLLYRWFVAGTEIPHLAVLPSMFLLMSFIVKEGGRRWLQMWPATGKKCARATDLEICVQSLRFPMPEKIKGIQRRCRVMDRCHLTNTYNPSIAMFGRQAAKPLRPCCGSTGKFSRSTSDICQGYRKGEQRCIYRVRF